MMAAGSISMAVRIATLITVNGSNARSVPAGWSSSRAFQNPSGDLGLTELVACPSRRESRHQASGKPHSSFVFVFEARPSRIAHVSLDRTRLGIGARTPLSVCFFWPGHGICYSILLSQQKFHRRLKDFAFEVPSFNALHSTHQNYIGA